MQFFEKFFEKSLSLFVIIIHPRFKKAQHQMFSTVAVVICEFWLLRPSN